MPVGEAVEGGIGLLPCGNRVDEPPHIVGWRAAGGEVGDALAVRQGCRRRLECVRDIDGLAHPGVALPGAGHRLIGVPGVPGSAFPKVSQAVDGRARTLPVEAPSRVVVKPAGEIPQGRVVGRPVRGDSSDGLERAGPVGHVEREPAGLFRAVLDRRHLPQQSGAVQRPRRAFDGRHRRLERVTGVGVGVQAAELRLGADETLILLADLAPPGRAFPRRPRAHNTAV